MPVANISVGSGKIVGNKQLEFVVVLCIPAWLAINITNVWQ